MKLVSWNVNGIRAVARKGLFPWIEREQPDILCFQETKAHPGQLPPELAQPSGYEAVFLSGKRKGYSGVSTWTRVPASGAAPSGKAKDTAAVHPKQIAKTREGIGIERFDQEGRTLTSEYEGFTLINCYFPNGQRDLGRLDFKMEFCESFLYYCNRLRQEGQRLIICGDFNTAHQEIDLARPKENQQNSGFLPVERAWIDQFVANGYVDTFRHFHDEPGRYTWWSYLLNARARNIGWRIDYFFVSEDLVGDLRSASIRLEVMGSDHCPIVLEIKA